MVIGDFNAKLGTRLNTDNNNILGPYGLGIRNERGTQLLQFAFGQNLSISNSYFYKKPQRRWTWFSSDKSTKNEIDFCLSSDKRIINNVEVINNFKFNSDHRALRISLKLDLKINRIKIIKNNIKRIDKLSLLSNSSNFIIELKNSFDLLSTQNSNDLETQYKIIQNSIKKASQNVQKTKSKTSKLSDKTKSLIEERQKLPMYTQEHKLKNKAVKRNIRKDIRKYNVNLVQTALEKNYNIKSAIKTSAEYGKPLIGNLKDSNGVRQSDRSKILSICTEFYKNLYSESSDTLSPLSASTAAVYSCPDNLDMITEYEVHRALLSMKFNRSPGHDGISTEALKIGEPALLPHLTNLFNLILKTGSLPKEFCHSNIILLHKKGDKSDLSNYRPISLVSHLYKTFIKIIELRISGKLDLHQPAEQAGFRRGLSTTDHLQALNQVLEKHIEFKMPLYLAFIDYSKAFDSIHHFSIFRALKDQEIDPIYINLLQNIYANSTASIKLHTLGQSFHIQRGVKQGDPLSPKLFTATLEQVFRNLATNWVEKGIIIGDKRLTNLRFADDIVLFSSSATELSSMINELNNASLEVGLRMNMAKTKLMTNSTKHRIDVDGVEIAYVQEYLYLGQIVSFQARTDKEISRRTENAWKCFWSMKDLMKGKLPLTLKKKLMDVRILPILTYGAQTWSLTKNQKFALGVCQRAMERSILGIKLSDRVRNTILRSETRIVDVCQKAASLKWNWAGHVCRMSDDLWAKRTTQWIPQNMTRQRGRPRRRWRDELDSYLRTWPVSALNREEWKKGREAFALQWDDNG